MTPAAASSAHNAHLAVQTGFEALAQGRRADALAQVRRAIRMDPHSEEAWLLLAAVAPPDRRAPYLNHLLGIHPGSKAAREALRELAAGGLTSTPDADSLDLPDVSDLLRPADAPPPDVTQPVVPRPLPAAPPAAAAAKPRGLNLRWSVLLVSLSCLLALLATSFAGFVTFAQEPPVMARLDKDEGTATPSFTPSFTPTITPSFTPTFTYTFTPSPTETPSPTLPPTNTPVPTVYIPPPPPGTGGERWIDVDISSQTLTAYEGNTPLRSFLVSTGVAKHPTVLGRYHIYVKYVYANMAGPGYFLPNVPYVMYFYKGYSIHGTYWHHNFGTPMSHGCVNMYTPDAAWMFDFASVGTLVNVHW